MAQIHSLASSSKRGTKYDAGPRIQIIADFGMDGDIHAKPGSDRQLTVLRREEVLALGPEFESAPPGAYAENIQVAGLPDIIKPGDRLILGGVVLEVTGIGKPEWKPGDFSYKGRAPVAKAGIFARVLCGGILSVGEKAALLSKV